MPDNNKAALRDEALIKKITEGLDLNNPRDITRIYNELQSGLYSFESKVGRDFDDHIFELYESTKNMSNCDAPSKKESKSKSATKNKNTKTKVEVKKYGKEIDELAILELKKQEKIRKILIFVAVFVAVCSFGYFGIYYYFSGRTSSDYEELSKLKGNDTLSALYDKNQSDFAVHKKSVKTPDMLDEYKTLFAKNNKMVGWLKIDGTNIDYPVMQTEDNEYYLNHNFDQQKDNNGSLFLDCGCSVYPRSTNMIIYGHHMKSGNMFGNLQKYAKESYYKEHPTITFDTIYEKATYQVIYAFYSKVYDNDDLVFKYYRFIDANSETEFDYYINEMKNLSLYDTGVEASFGDSLLTLSTCDHSQTDGRFAVVAKRIK